MHRSGRDPGRRIVDNPFYILGLDPDCARAQVEREGQKLLGMLELGLRGAATYATPLGPAPRTPEKVREAMAELRDPDRRLGHELWARLRPLPGRAPASPRGAAPQADHAPDHAGDDAGDDAANPPAGELAPWSGATVRLGWRRR